MNFDQTGVKFSEIENRTLFWISIVLLIFFVLIFYFGNAILFILPIISFLMQVIYPLILKRKYIVKFENKSLYFKDSPWARPKIIEIDDIIKIEPETLIDEIYKLNIELKNKSVYVFDTRYRDRLENVVEFINRLRRAS